MATPSESNYPRPEHADGQSAASDGRKHATPDVYIYLTVLMVLVISPGNVVSTPLQFIYKNQLHLTPVQMVNFKFLINIPGMLAFLLGFARDRFNPLKMGDRGFFLIFGLASGMIILAMSKVTLNVYTLGIGLVLWSISTGMIGAAFSALMRNISDHRMMSGRMSTLYNCLAGLIAAAAGLGGGWLYLRLDWRHLLILVAVTYLGIAGVAFWNPKGVFAGTGSDSGRSAAVLSKELSHIFRYRGYWVAVAMWGLWAFAPAGVTPIFLFCTNTLKMDSLQFSAFGSWFNVAAIPTTLLFGLLCKRFRLWPLLLISTVIGIPQWMPIAFLHTPTQVYVAAIFMGFVGGLATAAYYGLLLRACPKGLAGSSMLVASGLALAVTEVGNLIGGRMYQAWGFLSCALATTFAYALLLPLCFLLPRALVDPPDDKPVPTEEELIAA